MPVVRSVLFLALAGAVAVCVGVSSAASPKPKPATQCRVCIEKTGGGQTRRDLKLRTGPCHRNEIPVLTHATARTQKLRLSPAPI